MSDERPSAPAPALSPGRLILVVGPSGAGKDTIIAGARMAAMQNPAVVFPRRTVTRETSAAEDHDSPDEAEFVRRDEKGDFALVWQAHGLHYGIPRSIDDDIRAGRTVICNVSRGIIDAARARYVHVTVVEISAPASVLAERLSGRKRSSDGSLTERIARNAVYTDFEADVTIDNRGTPEAAIEKLLRVING